MSNSNSYVKFATLFFTLILLSIVSAYGQSTIFNIPSTDVAIPGTSYLEADAVAHFSGYSNGGFQTFGLRYTRGVSKRLEIGVNSFYTDSDGPGQPIEIQPNIKWQYYNNEDKGWAFSTGAMVFVPVRHRTNDRVLVMMYTNASKKVRGSYGPRVTGGFYQIAGHMDSSNTKTGGMFGYEQPLSRRISLLTDWSSGRNRFGYVGSGLSFILPKKSSLYVGYDFGNSGRGNNGFAGFYGVTF